MTIHRRRVCLVERCPSQLRFYLFPNRNIEDIPSKIPNPKLNNNAEIPALGFGTFANVLVEGETYAAVLAALDTVYRHLDCACQ
jgi:hypothetical protein